MKISKDQKSDHYEIHEDNEGNTIIHFIGRMDTYNAAFLIKKLQSDLKEYLGSSLIADLSRVGVLVLAELRDFASGSSHSFSLRNARGKVKDVLAVLNFDSLEKRVSFARKKSPSVFVRFGDATFRYVMDAKYLVSFVGSACLSLIYVVFHPKSLRMDDTLLCMQRAGVDAFPIVSLIAFLMGLIMAFMSSVQLQQFGANIYVASLVSLAMTRELGPIMTAIVFAGRSGSSFAAEIGTMKVSEEVDALVTMGFDPTRFLVVPKMIASVIVVPVLTLFSNVFAILGGLVVGVFMLDLTTSAYISQTISTLSAGDVFFGFMKSGIFALLIAWIGCLRGFQVRGGAASVGVATTSAMVSSIIFVVVTNSIFSILIRYWGL